MMQPETGGAPPPGHHHGPGAPSQIDDSQEHSADHADHAAATRPSEAANSELDSVFDAYFAIQRALSHDQFEPGQRAGEALVRAIEASSVVPLDSGLRESAKRISAAKDMETARAAFESVSNEMMVIAKKAGTGTRQRVLIYHCPMAFDNRGADWMQEKEGVENPYFGASMFNCGSLKESIDGRQEEAADE
jgi:Cu(I)/Ag(I) efflux system membrane fusion protein